MNASFVEEILQDIAAVMLRRAEVFSHSAPLSLGRIASGTYSAGHGEVTSFLRRNRNHLLCQNKLKELYLFDYFQRDQNNERLLIDEVLYWLNSGSQQDRADKMVRAYVQSNLMHYNRLVRITPVTQDRPAIFSSGILRSVMYLPWQSWRHARNKLGVRQSTDTSDAHQLIPGMMLTDALRRSGF